MLTSTTPASTTTTGSPADATDRPSDVAVILRRPRSVPGEEAYLRSEREQAAIDIAAGR